MGNSNLRQLAHIKEISFDTLSGSVVAVDAHNWLYRYLTTTVKFTRSGAYTTRAGEEVANLIGIVRGLPKFLEHDIAPVFVFDGGTVGLKDTEITERREQREEYEDQLTEAREAGADATEIATLESRTQRLTSTIQQTSREVLAYLDIPVIEAPAEGEAQAAYMARRGDVDYVGTEDYDALLLGAPCTLRQLTSSGNPELMDFKATLAERQLTWEQMVDVGLLMGTDFNEGISGVGPKTAVKLVREHGDLWGALDAHGSHIPNADRIRELFLNPSTTDAYEFDTECNPDMVAAREYVCDQWEVPADAVESGFARIEEAMTQTGLDRWT
jgi:flap endonuclease-1